MTLREIAIDDLDEHHLAALVERGVPEIRHIEYKRELPRSGESASKEFLADVCSFANAGGGDLVYGVEEESGAPVGLTGIPMPDPDREILRLENLIRDGIDPRPTGFASRAVPLAHGKRVLVIRVPRSVSRPPRRRLRQPLSLLLAQLRRQVSNERRRGPRRRSRLGDDGRAAPCLPQRPPRGPCSGRDPCELQRGGDRCAAYNAPRSFRRPGPERGPLRRTALPRGLPSNGHGRESYLQF